MLWIIAVVLIVLWLLGLLGHIGGNLVHVLLVIALIVIVFNFLQTPAHGLTYNLPVPDPVCGICG